MNSEGGLLPTGLRLPRSTDGLIMFGSDLRTARSQEQTRGTADSLSRAHNDCSLLHRRLWSFWIHAVADDARSAFAAQHSARDLVPAAPREAIQRRSPAQPGRDTSRGFNNSQSLPWARHEAQRAGIPGRGASTCTAVSA